MNTSINKGYLALAPAYSTRIQTNQFSERPEEVSISKVAKRKGSNPNSSAVKKKLKKTAESIVDDEAMNISQYGNGWSFYKR